MARYLLMVLVVVLALGMIPEGVGPPDQMVLGAEGHGWYTEDVRGGKSGVLLLADDVRGGRSVLLLAENIGGSKPDDPQHGYYLAETVGPPQPEDPIHGQFA